MYSFLYTRLGVDVGFWGQHTESYPQMSEWRCPVGGGLSDCNTQMNGKLTVDHSWCCA